MNRFEYKPIDLEGCSFRLLRLFHGNYGCIRCELFDAWLCDTNGSIEYEALSYTWGDTAKPHDIKINGRMMPVTKNLSLALQHLRCPYEDQILWVDAIYINQENDKERAHQVVQMTSIYKRAKKVLIWLG
ncbi:HET-domain-containing protein [Byssothecium circinans]|uniref:HET-domain-containing protein n=1 Tax=Byssothecium circinans TaxID=147558 RepID=A0A6A5TZU9_9PLEO|nr:HET-domain-containing protein [Byssothecium circinans]